jgi:uncharacterized membrane protein
MIPDSLLNSGAQATTEFQRGAGSRHSQNVAALERVLSALGGAGLILDGLRRRSFGGLAQAAIGGMFVQRGLSGHCPLYGALGIGSRRPGPGRSRGVPAHRGIEVERTITLNASPEQLYQFWRDFRNLPRVMKHLEAVESVDQRTSHWVARGPLDRNVEWYAEIINDIPNELIAWQSLEDSDVGTAGSVHFQPAPNGRGTEVRVRLRYDPPGGIIGAAFAKLFGEEPAQQIEGDLRRFKHIMEAGELPTTVGQPRGARRGES